MLGIRVCLGEEGDFGGCLSSFTRLEDFEGSPVLSGDLVYPEVLEGLTSLLDVVGPASFETCRVNFGDGDFDLVTVGEEYMLSSFRVIPGKARRRRSELILD